MGTTNSILLKSFDQTLTSRCSAKEIIKNKSKELIAVKCNCDKYHPILSGNIRWGDEISDEVLLDMIRRNVSYARILAEQ